MRIMLRVVLACGVQYVLYLLGASLLGATITALWFWGVLWLLYRLVGRRTVNESPVRQSSLSGMPAIRGPR